jgi:ferredoxin-nitrate reductase
MRSGASVVRLSTEERTADLSDGSTVEFDRFVVATGSQPSLPPVAGLERRGVHAFRSLRDVARILASPARGARAVVIGGGLLGLEAARGLQARGRQVTVVHLADHLMEQQLDPLGAGLLQRRLRELGVEVLLEAATTEIAGNGSAEGVRLADGRELDADLVVVATGINPDVELARAAGIDVDRGVVVDDELRTSLPSGWAVGECAEHRGVVYGLWAPLVRQTKVAAAVMSGKPAAFHGAVPATTLKVMGVDLFCAGRAQPLEGEEEVLFLDSRRGRYRKLVLAGDRLMGAVLLGDLTEAVTLRQLVEDGRTVPADLLEPNASAKPQLDGIVCACAAVSRDEIERAIATEGLTRVSQIARDTGATTGCGGCRAAVEQLIAEQPRETLREARAARAGY